jgi:hypothetical protein
MKHSHKNPLESEVAEFRLYLVDIFDQFAKAKTDHPIPPAGDSNRAFMIAWHDACDPF